MTSKINKHGQATIPAYIRAKKGISPGDEVSFEIQGNQIVVQILPKQTLTLEDVPGFLDVQVSLSDEDIAQAKKWAFRSS